MLRDYFSPAEAGHRPFIRTTIQIPAIGSRYVDVRLLVDTGADRSVLAPRDAAALGVDFTILAPGTVSTGIGGEARTRSIDARIGLGDVPMPSSLLVLSPRRENLSMPSLLGRDILSHFALFIEERTERVLLLEPDEVAQLRLP